MTDEQIAAWMEERDMARGIKDEADRNIALQKCYDHRDKMMMTCLAHQSDRVKHILVDHDDMVQSHKEYQAELLRCKIQEKSVHKLLTVVKYGATIIGSTGLGAAIMKWIGG